MDHTPNDLNAEMPNGEQHLREKKVLTCAASGGLQPSSHLIALGLPTSLASHLLHFFFLSCFSRLSQVDMFLNVQSQLDPHHPLPIP